MEEFEQTGNSQTGGPVLPFFGRSIVALAEAAGDTQICVCREVELLRVFRAGRAFAPRTIEPEKVVLEVGVGWLLDVKTWLRPLSPTCGFADSPALLLSLRCRSCSRPCTHLRE